MKKVRYTNVEWGKQYYLDYQALSKDSSRRRVQKVFLKQFSKCGLFYPACNGINVSAKTVQRWMEKDDWFRRETLLTFEFVIEHYVQELELIPPNRRHKLFAQYRIPYEGKKIYDLTGRQVAEDEIINDSGERVRIMTPLKEGEEYHYHLLIEAEQTKSRNRPDYIDGDKTYEEQRLEKELEARRLLAVSV